MRHIRMLFFVFVFLAFGCVSSSSYTTQVLDGTLIQVGLFLPYNGSLYGIQCLQYISGRSAKTRSTNDVISTHSISSKSTAEVYSLELRNQ